MASSWVALFRGVNVGGNNKLPMKELVALFEEAGCTGVCSYIQSGNVVFQAPARVATSVAQTLPAHIEKQFGFRPPIVLRSADALAEAIRSNPFLERGIDPSFLHVAFLAEKPKPAAVAALDPSRSPGDELIVRGSDVFLHLPNGMGRTRITNAYLDSALKTISTARNWRTVLKLAELAGG